MLTGVDRFELACQRLSTPINTYPQGSAGCSVNSLGRPCTHVWWISPLPSFILDQATANRVGSGLVWPPVVSRQGLAKRLCEHEKSGSLNNSLPLFTAPLPRARAGQAAKDRQPHRHHEPPQHAPLLLSPAQLARQLARPRRPRQASCWADRRAACGACRAHHGERRQKGEDSMRTNACSSRHGGHELALPKRPRGVAEPRRAGRMSEASLSLRRVVPNIAPNIASRLVCAGAEGEPAERAPCALLAWRAASATVEAQSTWRASRGARPQLASQLR